MIGIDTNVLVRYLAQDDAKQSAAARALIDDTLTEEVPGFIAPIVLVETVWVMEDLYGADRERVASIIETLLHARTVVVADAEIVWRALATFRAGRADFADCLIQKTSEAAGCDVVYTFDRLAARDSGMQLLRGFRR